MTLPTFPTSATKWAYGSGRFPEPKGLEHRIGGLEKANETGNVSHDPANHALMTKLRAEKVEKIADCIPLQTLDNGTEKGDILVLGWGSTYGAIKIAVDRAIKAGHSVSHAHVRYLNPFPKKPRNNAWQLQKRSSFLKTTAASC